MTTHKITLERARFFSVVGVFVVAGGLLAFLFHEQENVTIALDGPAELHPGESATYLATITIPPGQRLPIEGSSLVVEAATAPPSIMESATCWGDVDCAGGIRHAGPLSGVVKAIERVDSVEPTLGPLRVRVEGYGRSSAGGYGQEVEAARSLRAPDIGADGRDSYGFGYGDADAPVVLQYRITLDPSPLAEGAHHITFFVQTGSHEMGDVSGPRLTVAMRAP